MTNRAPLEQKRIGWSAKPGQRPRQPCWRHTRSTYCRAGQKIRHLQHGAACEQAEHRRNPDRPWIDSLADQVQIACNQHAKYARPQHEPAGTDTDQQQRLRAVDAPELDCMGQPGYNDTRGQRDRAQIPDHIGVQLQTPAYLRHDGQAKPESDDGQNLGRWQRQRS